MISVNPLDSLSNGAYSANPLYIYRSPSDDNAETNAVYTEQISLLILLTAASQPVSQSSGAQFGLNGLGSKPEQLLISDIDSTSAIYCTL